MTFSYDATVPTDSDQVRFLLGDTAEPGEVSNEEIAWALSYQGSPASAAQMLAESLAARYAGKANVTVGSVTVDNQQIAAGYRQLAKDLLGTTEAAIAGPWAGGISIADKQNRVGNTDRVAPFFSRGTAP